MISFMIHTPRCKIYRKSIKAGLLLDNSDIIIYTICECIKRRKEVIDEKNIKCNNGSGDDILSDAARKVVCAG